MQSAYYNLGAGDLVFLETGRFEGLRCKAVSIVPFDPRNALGLVHHSHGEGKEPNPYVAATLLLQKL